MKKRENKIQKINKYLNTIIYLINYYGTVRKKNNLFKHDC